MAALRSGLLGEIVAMSWDTLRSNKLRSALTVLGIVIGITSIVGMTAMIRGFDESIRDVFRTLGPNTVYVSKMSVVSSLKKPQRFRWVTSKRQSRKMRRPAVTRR